MVVRKCKCVRNGSRDADQPSFSSSPIPHLPRKRRECGAGQYLNQVPVYFFVIKKHQRKGTGCPKSIFVRFCAANRASWLKMGRCVIHCAPFACGAPYRHKISGSLMYDQEWGSRSEISRGCERWTPHELRTPIYQWCREGRRTPDRSGDTNNAPGLELRPMFIQMFSVRMYMFPKCYVGLCTPRRTIMDLKKKKRLRD